jgi:hypothetical protein
LAKYIPTRTSVLSYLNADYTMHVQIISNTFGDYIPWRKVIHLMMTPSKGLEPTRNVKAHGCPIVLQLIAYT